MKENFKYLNTQLVFDEPELIVESAWLGHAPFAFWLTESLRPSTFVELGTHSGFSYCSVCQAVSKLKLNTRTYAIDTWKGDAHSRNFSEQVFTDLNAYNQLKYADFSKLCRGTFDQALPDFDDKSIDLLHIDGFHTYEAVKHDFTTWLPKLSERGVILFHDINVFENDFGVWKLWEELSVKYPSFSFEHSHGLGIIAVGTEIAEPIQWLTSLKEQAEISEVRSFFSRLGSVVERCYERTRAFLELAKVTDQLKDLQTQLAGKEKQVTKIKKELENYYTSSSLPVQNNIPYELKFFIEAFQSKIASLNYSLLWAKRQIKDWQQKNLNQQDQIKALTDHCEYLTQNWYANNLKERFSQIGLSPEQAYQIMHSRLIKLIRKWWRFKATLSELLSKNEKINSEKKEESKFALSSETSQPSYNMQKQQHIHERYNQMISNNEAIGSEHEKLLKSDNNHESGEVLRYRPLISILMPVFKTPLLALEQAIISVENQSYKNYEICIVHAGGDPGCKSLLDRYSVKNNKIKVQEVNENLGISGNSNLALKMATGEFVALMDHDDTISEDALFEYISVLNRNPELDIIYSDEDKITESGERCYPFFKPDYSPELLHNSMYIGHLTVYRKSLIESLGGFRSDFDGSQDYDLILRATEKSGRIYHIPKILYHWRMLPTSAASDSGAKNYARVTNLKALEQAMHRRGFKGKIVEYPVCNRFRFEIANQSLVSIIIPSDDYDNIKSCVEAVFDKTEYLNFEVLVVTNSALVKSIRENLRYEKLKAVTYDAKFNFSAKCNAGAQAASGDYFIFLNDDVAPLSSDWIESMLEYGQQEDIAGVSPKLLYSDDSIQYAGMVTAVPDMVGTSFHQWGRYDCSYHNLALSVRNVTVLTGACCLVRKSIFWEVGGWDAINTPIMNSDLDFSFKLLETGRRLVYTPFAELRHIGHVSIGRTEQGPRADDISHIYILEKWTKYIEQDPYFTAPMREILYPKDREVNFLPAKVNKTDKINDAGPKNTKNILVVSHEMTISGAPTGLYRLVKGMVSKGWHVTVIAPETGALVDAYRDAGITVIIDSMILKNPYLARHMFSPYDLVIANTVMAWKVVHACKSIEKKVLWKIHESEFGLEFILNNEAAQLAFGMADAVTYPSYCTNELYSFFRTHEKHFTIPVGIPDPLDQQKMAESSKRSDGKISIVYSGSIEKRKGADILVAALAILPAEIKEQIEVKIIGRFLEPEFAEQISARCKELEFVKMLGEVPYQQALQHVALSDIFVCTSREEAGPLVVYEAMALCRAVISTRVGAAGEHIEDGKNGWIVPLEDPESLAQAIKKLYQNDGLRDHIGRNARKTFEQFFTLEKYNQRVIDLCTKIIESSSLHSLVREEEHYIRTRIPTFDKVHEIFKDCVN